jgi:DNA repair protein RecN (Recombination protein N)
VLTYLEIRNFVLAEHVELSLQAGMSVLTGETGAGKSILVDALSLLLGERADPQMIRHGEARADLHAEFNLSARPRVVDWLQAQDLADTDQPEHCLLQRTLQREGASRARINGLPVTLTQLRELGDQLVDIHGQHAHQSLLQRDAQRSLLDEFGQLTLPLEHLQAAWQQWKRIQEEANTLQHDEQERLQLVDLLGFQLRELRELAPQEGEYADLKLESTRLASVSQLQEAGHHALLALNEQDESNALSLLQQAEQSLLDLQALDSSTNALSEGLASAIAQIEDLRQNLRDYLDHLEADPQRLDEVQARIAEMQRLARKHGIEASALPERLTTLQQQVDALENADARRAQLNAELEQAATACIAAATQLSQARTKAAKKLEKAVTSQLHGLGFQGGSFTVALEINPEQQQAPPSSRFGWEHVEFRVSTNPGQPQHALAKTASGGELSRIALALQVAALENSAQSSRPPTLIFDEVDTGIGGRVADMVGQRLRALSAKHQVLVITHLPQVAAQGQHHWRVHKHSEGKSKDVRTWSTLTVLDVNQRIEEIARMLGGSEISASARANAKELLGLSGSIE